MWGMSMTLECGRLIKIIADARLWRDIYPDGPDILESEGSNIRITADDVRSARDLLENGAKTDAAAWQPTHRHRKTGGLYRLVTEGWIEATKTRCVVYEDKDRCTWVRHADEFYDGRFEPLPAPPAGPATEQERK
jgi:hypothetical protein